MLNETRKNMPTAYENIKSLIAGKNEKGIILRLVRKYVVPDFYGGKRPLSLECIFHDGEGERIHASIGQMQMEKFNDMLIEGNIYSVMDFVVGSNKMKIKTTRGDHKLLIFKCTRIYEIKPDDFPKNIFNFNTISEIRDMDNNAPTFDVIGIVVCSYSPQMINCSGKSKRLIKLVLEDIEGQTMKCTLWENYAEHMMKFIEEGPVAPPGIILQFCSTNIFRGEVELQNCFDITKLIVDQELEEIKDYKAKYLAATGKGADSTISTLTAPPSSGKTIAAEYKEGELQVKSLMELQKEDKEGVYLVHATIVCVEYAKDWAYFSCKLCRKKLKKEGQTYECNNCGIAEATAILRYKLIVRVVDDTDTALFLLWDKDSVALIGRQATEFNQGEDVQLFPPALDAILSNKSALFKVNVVSQDRFSDTIFPVVKLETDQEIIRKVCEKRSDQAETSLLSNSGEQVTKSNEVVSFTNENSTPTESSAKMGKSVEMCDAVEAIAKSLTDEFSTSMPKKKLKRLKQEK